MRLSMRYRSARRGDNATIATGTFHEASFMGAALAPQAVADKQTLQRVFAGAFGDDDATVARRSPSSLVLFTRWRRALRERPDVIGELQHQ